MQIAGTNCFVCHRNVGTVNESVGCRTCEVFAHAACAGDAACPRCSRPLISGRQLHTLPGKSNPAHRAASSRPPGVTFLALLVICVGLLNAAVAAFLPVLPTWLGTIVTFQAVIGLVCGGGFLRGQNWARVAYLWITPVLIIAAALVPTIPGVETTPAETWILPSVGYTVILVYLTRPRVRRFFTSGSNADEVEVPAQADTQVSAPGK